MNVQDKKGCKICKTIENCTTKKGFGEIWQSFILLLMGSFLAIKGLFEGYIRERKENRYFIEIIILKITSH